MQRDLTEEQKIPQQTALLPAKEKIRARERVENSEKDLGVMNIPQENCLMGVHLPGKYVGGEPNSCLSALW